MKLSDDVQRLYRKQDYLGPAKTIEGVELVDVEPADVLATLPR